MQLNCCICKDKIDIEKELALFFQCYVYCGKCIKEMERKGEISGKSSKGRKESDIQKGY